MNDVLRLLAAWALAHEAADEGWRAASTPVMITATV